MILRPLNIQIPSSGPTLVLQVPKEKYTQVWVTKGNRLAVKNRLDRRYITLPNGTWEIVNTEDVKIFFNNILKVTVQLKRNTRKFLVNQN